MLNSSNLNPPMKMTCCEFVYIYRSSRDIIPHTGIENPELPFLLHKTFLMTTVSATFLPSLAIVLLCGTLVSKTIADDPVWSVYEKWMGEFGRVYKSDTEKQQRFEVFKANFEFVACTETHPSNGFEDFPRSQNGVYYGHLSPLSSSRPNGNPTKCVTHRSLYADEAFLTSEDCYLSDDSGSVASYFSFTPSQHGQINFLGYTGPKGGEPETAEQKKSQYDFNPGTDAQHPAVTVHDGSPNFSDWVLRLE